MVTRATGAVTGPFSLDDFNRRNTLNAKSVLVTRELDLRGFGGTRSTKQRGAGCANQFMGIGFAVAADAAAVGERDADRIARRFRAERTALTRICYKGEGEGESARENPWENQRFRLNDAGSPRRVQRRHPICTILFTHGATCAEGTMAHESTGGRPEGRNR